MLHFDPRESEVRDIFGLLLGGVGPRPIALVSTISSDGIANLAPFSFFNAFGANPPTVAFSPSRRLRDNTVKDTYTNLVATGECVIQAVTQKMVHQVNLSSAEFASEVDEFARAGFTPAPSDMVAPPRVQESPFQMECKLSQMIALGESGASGNLAVCEVVLFHVSEEIMTNGTIDQRKIDLVARLGGNFYCRASGEALFELPKPSSGNKIGYDRLPEFVRSSRILSALSVCLLASHHQIPTTEDARTFCQEIQTADVFSESAFTQALSTGDYHGALSQALSNNSLSDEKRTYLYQEVAQCALESATDVSFAWHVLIGSQD